MIFFDFPASGPEGLRPGGMKVKKVHPSSKAFVRISQCNEDENTEEGNCIDRIDVFFFRGKRDESFFLPSGKGEKDPKNPVDPVGKVLV